jgi:hypothetical protein
MMKSEKTAHFAVCLNNDGYPASLEVGKLYRVIPDKEVAADGYLRVIDESGEDYAFAENRFYLVKLPANVEQALIAHGPDSLGLTR